MTDPTMSKADRDALIRISRARSKQADRDLDARKALLIAEAVDAATAEYAAHDELWKQGVVIAEEAVVKANAEIQARCLELGVPAGQAPKLELAWHSRSSQFGDSKRRAELLKLAEKRLTALIAEAKTVQHARQLDYEEQLILGGLDSQEARDALAAMPSAEQLVPPLTLEDLGVKRWQPPDDAAAQLTTPTTTAGRRRRQILRAIEANPGSSNRAIAAMVGCDHKTVAAHRTDDGGEAPTTGGEIPAVGGEFPTPATGSGELE